jgi:uncharacterized protein affecting Mg2+/Co2+ transport
MKNFYLFIFLFSYLFNQTVEIQSGSIQENSYIEGESVYYNVQVENTGSVTISGLWLNVDISDQNGTNVREGLWQYLPTLDNDETYETEYDSVWDIPIGVLIGDYSVTVGLRDDLNIYDIEYDIDNFNI